MDRGRIRVARTGRGGRKQVGEVRKGGCTRVGGAYKWAHTGRGARMDGLWIQHIIFFTPII
jgi:hypothetical protein